MLNEKYKNWITFFVVQWSTSVTETKLPNRQKFLFKNLTLISRPSVEGSVAVAPFGPVNTCAVNAAFTFTRTR